MIGHADARLATRRAAVSGDVRGRSTGGTIGRVAMRLNADPGLATGYLTVAGNGVGAGSAVGLICENAADVHHARIIGTFVIVVTRQRRRYCRV
ncbi:MAG TPA: hypothetical protein VF290_15130 [Pyrinomonadaceae bacterium]